MNKKAQAGNEWSDILLKSLSARKKPSHDQSQFILPGSSLSMSAVAGMVHDQPEMRLIANLSAVACYHIDRS